MAAQATTMVMQVIVVVIAGSFWKLLPLNPTCRYGSGGGAFAVGRTQKPACAGAIKLYMRKHVSSVCFSLVFTVFSPPLQRGVPCGTGALRFWCLAPTDTGKKRSGRFHTQHFVRPHGLASGNLLTIITSNV